MPAELRGGGGLVGEGRRLEIVLTVAENSASKFYQLSSEEVGAGLGGEDACGGGDLDLHGNEPRQPLPPALCLTQSPSPLPASTLCQHSFPAAPVGLLLIGAGRARGRCGRSRNQGQNWDILSGSPWHTPWRPGASQTHLILIPSLGVGTAIIPSYRGGRLRHRTVRQPRSLHSEQTHRQEAAALALATGTCDLERLDHYLASTSLPTTGTPDARRHSCHCPALLQNAAQPCLLFREAAVDCPHHQNPCWSSPQAFEHRTSKRSAERARAGGTGDQRG